jgi:hypothetical protein
MSNSYKGLDSSVKDSSSDFKKRSDKARRRKTKYTGIDSSVSASTRIKSQTRAKKVRQVRIMPLNGQNLVQQLPETSLSEKGLSLKKLFQNTPRLITLRGIETSVKKLKNTKTASGLPAVTSVCIHRDPYRPDALTREHKVHVIGRVRGLKISDRKQKVLVSCDCENFVYYWEFADAKYGAARLIYGNGEKPVFTNPGESPGLCKHLSATATEIISRGL